jgi:hypothetical protein
VSEPLPPKDAHTGDTEEIDAVVVTPTPRALPARQVVRVLAPAVQAAAVAAGSFVAGAAAVGLVQRRRHRRELVRVVGRRRAPGGARRGRGARGAGEVVQIVGSRSLLVDVHLLGGRR